MWLKSKDVDVIYVTISQYFLEILEISYFILSVSKSSRVIIHLHGGGIRKLIFDKIGFSRRLIDFYNTFGWCNCIGTVANLNLLV